MDEKPDLLAEVEYYKNQLHETAERLQRATSAAASAAASTVTAIERIQEMEKVVNAAIHWYNSNDRTQLHEAVTAWLRYKDSWS